MKQWEDIFKEKLDGYDSRLPEGSLEDFRARLEESRKPSKKSHGRYLWLIAAISAVAACFVFFLIPVRSGISSLPEDTVAEVRPVDSDVSDKLDEVPNELPLVTREVTKNESGFETKESVIIEETVEEEPIEIESVEEEPIERYSSITEKDVDISSFPGPVATNPATKAPVKINVRAGSVARGLVGVSAIGGTLASVGAFNPTHTSSPIDDSSPSHSVIRDPVLDTTYRAPVKVGIGFRYAVSERLYISSGVGYSQYATDYNFTYKGKVSQIARYINIPLRVDYGVFESRWVDAYLGLGTAADFCVHASIDAEDLKKEGTTYSLIGAAGVQVNITNHIGAFVEPQLSWAISSEKRVQETYRYIHPVSLEVATGIRFTFGK